MSCRRRSGYRRLVHRLTAYWGILKWPSLGEFGWPPGQGGENCRHAGRRRHTRLCSLKSRQPLLKRGYCWVGEARVDVAGLAAGKSRRRLGGVLEYETRCQVQSFRMLIELTPGNPAAQSQCFDVLLIHVISRHRIARPRYFRLSIGSPKMKKPVQHSLRRVEAAL